VTKAASKKPEVASKPLFLRLSAHTRSAVEAYAKREGLTLNEAGARLIVRGLDPRQANLADVRKCVVLDEGTRAVGAKPGLAATPGAPYFGVSAEQRGRGASIVSGLNVQLGPTPRRGPLLKKAAK
jgi:hypothetical protein